MLARLLKIGMFLLAVIGQPGSGCCGENRIPSDNEVKSAYIYNFAKFVEWPQGNLPDQNGNIDVCVLGNEQLGHHLAAVEGKSVRDKKIRFKRNPSIENIKDCEILFIGRSEKGHLDRILDAVQGSAILTIADSDGFARKGVMIKFFMENKNVRFEINLRSVSRSGLRISSNLLRISRIVQE